MRAGMFDRLMGSSAPGGPAAAPASAGPAGGGGIDRPLTANAGRQWEGKDPASRLPKAAADKLARLRTRAAEAIVLLQDLDRRRTAAGEAAQRAEAYVDHVRHGRASGGGSRMPSRSTYISGHGMPDPGWAGVDYYQPPVATDGQGRPLAPGDQGRPGDAQLAEAEQALAEAREVQAAVNRETTAKEAQRSRLPGEIDRWLRWLPADVKIEAYRPSEAAKRAGATVADIEAARQQIDALRSEIHTIRSANPLSSEVKRRARAQVEALADRGRPNYLGAVEAGQPIKLPELNIQGQIATGAGLGISYSSVPDVYGFLCWLHGDAIIAKMEADISELADDEGALSDEEKREREGTILVEILETERAEEALIEQLEMSNVTVARRDNADIRAVLSLSSDLPGAAPMF